MAWECVVGLRGEMLAELAARLGGRAVRGAEAAPTRIRPIDRAGTGDLAPLLSARFARHAADAVDRGAALLVDATLAGRVSLAPMLWVHEHAAWAMAAVLDSARVPDVAATVGEGSSIAASAVLGPRVVVGARVTIGPGAVVGYPGFGWASGPDGSVRPVPQLAGVVIEDDVSIGPLCTIDAGTLAPTRVRRGAKIDAHVHVGHNVDIGEGAVVAAQCGFAGSVKIGAGVLIGGQVGVADHVS